MSASSIATPSTQPRTLLTPRRRRLLGNVLGFLALGVVSIVMLFPLYLMILISFRTAEPTSAGYVAIERVTGSLHGRKGSFVLQHHCTMLDLVQLRR